MADSETTFYVKYVVQSTRQAICATAKMGHEVALMTKTVNKDVWQGCDEAQLVILRDLAGGRFITEAEANRQARKVARDYLYMYGGSRELMKQGLNLLEEREIP